MNNKGNDYFSIFAGKVTKWMQRAKWRTGLGKDWELKNFDAPKLKKRNILSSTEFLGLENMGCTCYMNSIVQQLFMISPFRSAIMSVTNQSEAEEKSEDTLYHTKLLFASLQNTGTSYHNPEHFFKTIKDIDGSELNPLEQRDADEFLSRFFEIIEPQIKHTDEEKDISNLFTGSFANQMICIDCPHKSERFEDFTTLACQVKNKHSLNECLDSFIESEILQGDNAYYCEKCDIKVSCKRRTCIKKLPNILTIALKRFEIDYETMTHSKINDRVEFPMELQMNKYTDRQLEKEDLLQEMEEMNWSYEDLPEDKRQIYDFSYPEEYYTYNLRGVVVHMGEANAGHYYSYIKDTKNGQWYEFNDTMVTPFDPDEMDDKAFGGEYGASDRKFSRWRNAGNKPYNGYMLLYEREYFIDTNGFMEASEANDTTLADLNKFFNLKFTRFETSIRTESFQDREVEDVVSSHNKAIWETKQLFSKSLARLFYRISEDYSFSKEGKEVMEDVRKTNLHDFDNLPDSKKHKWVSTYHRQALTIIYFHSTVLRAHTKPYLAEFCRAIRESLERYFPVAFFYIENFCKTDVIFEFITMRKLNVLRMQVPYFIKIACKRVYEAEEDMIAAY